VWREEGADVPGPRTEGGGKSGACLFEVSGGFRRLLYKARPVFLFSFASLCKNNGANTYVLHIHTRALLTLLA